MFTLTHSFLTHGLLVCHHPARVHTQWRASSCSSLVITPPTPASRLLPALPPLFCSFGPFHPLIFTGTSLPLVATGVGSKECGSTRFLSGCLTVCPVCLWLLCPSRSGVVSVWCVCLCVRVVCTRVCVIKCDYLQDPRDLA